MKLNTRDIGVALRDHLEEKSIFALRENEAGNLCETPHAFEVTFVDVSDPRNPVIEIDNQQRFKLHIVSI